MKMLWVLSSVMVLSLAATAATKLSDKAAMTCISDDKPTRSAFLDLEQGYEMRSISAKDFFSAFDKSSTCPQLRKNIRKLHGDMIARLPTPSLKSQTRYTVEPSPSTTITSQPPNAEFFPPPPPMNFDEDASSFLE